MRLSKSIFMMMFLFVTAGRAETVFSPHHNWVDEPNREWSVSDPKRLCSDGSYVYVTHSYYVTKYDLQGNAVTNWGGSGTADGQIATACGIDVDKGEVFVVDVGNDRIQVFDTDGTFLRKWGASGAGPGQLETPYGLDVESDEVFVTDLTTDRVTVFDRQGTYLRSWGSYGTSLGFFYSPRAISVDKGFVFVTDGAASREATNNRRIQVFRRDGRFVRSWDAPWWYTMDIEVSGDVVYYTSFSQGQNSNSIVHFL